MSERSGRPSDGTVPFSGDPLRAETAEPTGPDLAPPGPPIAPLLGGVSLARMVLSGLLVAVGLVWLLDSAGLLEVSWGALLPVALVVIGLALIAGARTGSHSGLVAVGVILTVVLTVGSALNIPVAGGVGERTEHPTSLGQVPASYELAFGSLRIDLSDLPLEAGDTEITARVGMGELRVTVPGRVRLQVNGEVTGGQIVVFGEERNGVSVEEAFVVGSPVDGSTLVLNLRIGFGSIVVER